MDGFKRRHHEASTAMDGREERLDELYEEIEKDLMVRQPAKQNSDTIWFALSSYVVLQMILILPDKDWKHLKSIV